MIWSPPSLTSFGRRSPHCAWRSTLCTEQVAGPLTDKQAELLYAAREDCDRLQAMVDDILDLSRIESGKIELIRYRLPCPISWRRPSKRIRRRRVPKACI